MKKIVIAILLIATICFYGCDSNTGSRKILVFTKTKGYHHESIPAGVAALEKLGKENDFKTSYEKATKHLNSGKVFNHLVKIQSN